MKLVKTLDELNKLEQDIRNEIGKLRAKLSSGEIAIVSYTFDWQVLIARTNMYPATDKEKEGNILDVTVKCGLDKDRKGEVNSIEHRG